MSVALARHAMTLFLASPEPEVLCIRGKWGTGKTFAWNDVLTRQTSIALTKYAYVSLFGINSLDAARSAIFENTVSIETRQIKANVDSFSKNLVSLGETMGRKGVKFLFQNPFTSKYIGGLEALTFLSVRNTIVCIDDLERRGLGLGMGDVLGLISFLKTERQCKVVAILNDEKLDGTGKSDFARYFEKVVDISINYEPTAEECAKIALAGSGAIKELMRSNCAALGVSNIRIIKQIERLAKIVVPQLEKLDQSVVRQAIQTLVLLGWCKHSIDDITVPSLDFITHKRGKSLYGLTKPSQMTEDEKVWDTLLDKYGFSRLDEFDLALLDGIERGYFDDQAVAKTAKQLDDAVKAQHLEGSFSAAWGMYHDTFDNNELEVVAALKNSFIKAIKQITPINLNGTVRLLKDLNHPEIAKELVDQYVLARKDETEIFKLGQSPFGADVNDPDVRIAFASQVSQTIDDRNPSEILLHIAKNSSWNPEDIELLSSLKVEDYYKIFKDAGTNGSRIIAACLQFNKLAGTDDKMKSIGSNAAAALRIIGSESPINRRRVLKYGIEIEDGN